MERVEIIRLVRTLHQTAGTVINKIDRTKKLNPLSKLPEVNTTEAAANIPKKTLCRYETTLLGMADDHKASPDRLRAVAELLRVTLEQCLAETPADKGGLAEGWDVPVITVTSTPDLPGNFIVDYTW